MSSQIVELLFEAGADLGAADVAGRSAADAARARGHAALAAMLHEYGCEFRTSSAEEGGGDERGACEDERGRAEAEAAHATG